MGHDKEFWQNVAHWRREWLITPMFLPWELHKQYEKVKRTPENERSSLVCLNFPCCTNSAATWLFLIQWKLAPFLSTLRYNLEKFHHSVRSLVSHFQWSFFPLPWSSFRSCHKQQLYQPWNLNVKLSSVSPFQYLTPSVFWGLQSFNLPVSLCVTTSLLLPSILTSNRASMVPTMIIHF